MTHKFIDLDISTMTFSDLSPSWQRRSALFITVVIWCTIVITTFMFVPQLSSSTQFVEEASVLLMVATLVHYIIKGDFIVFSAVSILLKITPLGVLYEKDKRTIEKGRSGLLGVAKAVDFEDYIVYGKVNPAIRSKKFMQVISHQKKNDLDKWTQNTSNLKKLADFVYQIYLVEQLLANDSTKGR